MRIASNRESTFQNPESLREVLDKRKKVRAKLRKTNGRSEQIREHNPRIQKLSNRVNHLLKKIGRTNLDSAGEALLNRANTLLDKLSDLIRRAKEKAGDSPSKELSAPSQKSHISQKSYSPQSSSYSSGPSHPAPSNDFLWKPSSEKNGNLVILLPAFWTGLVENLSILTPLGQSIPGNFASVANGGREHYRFDQAGADFPPGSSVQIRMKDGSVHTLPIGDTSARLQMPLSPGN